MLINTICYVPENISVMNGKRNRRKRKKEKKAVVGGVTKRRQTTSNPAEVAYPYVIVTDGKVLAIGMSCKKLFHVIV